MALGCKLRSPPQPPGVTHKVIMGYQTTVEKKPTEAGQHRPLQTHSLAIDLGCRLLACFTIDPHSACRKAGSFSPSTPAAHTRCTTSWLPTCSNSSSSGGGGSGGTVGVWITTGRVACRKQHEEAACRSACRAIAGLLEGHLQDRLHNALAGHLHKKCLQETLQESSCRKLVRPLAGHCGPPGGAYVPPARRSPAAAAAAQG